MEEIKLCGRCNKPKGKEEGCCKCGRPTDYSEEILTKTKEYIDNCNDTDEDKEHNIKYKVNLPTIEGLALYLNINKDTIYEWRKEKPEFSEFIAKLLAKQAERLVNNGLSGDYSHVIAKVLLTKHGYREGIDQTTNDKDLPIPIFKLDAILSNHSNPEDSEPKK